MTGKIATTMAVGDGEGDGEHTRRVIDMRGVTKRGGPPIAKGPEPGVDWIVSGR